MRRSPLFAWLCLLVWGVWLFAVQGALASGGSLASWTPDLGLVLLLALDPRLSRRDARIAALLVACARAALSADPPLALLAGYLGVVGVTGVLRSGLEIDRPLARALVAGLAAAALAAFWRLARAAEVPELAGIPAGALAASAAATASAALLLVPLFRRLPGLAALSRSRR